MSLIAPTIKLKSVLAVCGALIILNLGAVLLYANSTILQYETYIIEQEQITTRETTLVFGGGMQGDGSQTFMQMDRVTTAAELYENDHTSRIIMTGDDGANRYDEVHAMQLQAIEYGIPKEHVLVDPHGYRTYESCWRAAHVYELGTIFVVSQDFHLPRILYICRSMGIDALGIEANLRDYSKRWIVQWPREILARLKAWWQVEVTKPLPQVTE